MTDKFLHLQPAHSLYSVGEYAPDGSWKQVVDGEYTDRRVNAERKAAA